jgi:hypothetical protein
MLPCDFSRRLPGFEEGARATKLRVVVLTVMFVVIMVGLV